MRRLLHAVIVQSGAIPWLVAYWAGATCVFIAWLADLVLPDADRGNCWSFALPKWACNRPTLPDGTDTQRGGLMLQFVETARFMRIFPVIHCVWLPDGPGRTPLQMTRPVDRQRFRWLPLRTFFFQYSVLRIVRRTGNTEPAPLGD